MRLLVVEDNRKLAAIIAKLLAENLYSVDTVETVDEAHAAVELVDYDVILLDLTLPDGDGGEILRSLRRAGRATRILVATARAAAAVRNQTNGAGSGPAHPRHRVANLARHWAGDAVAAPRTRGPRHAP